MKYIYLDQNNGKNTITLLKKINGGDKEINDFIINFLKERGVKKNYFRCWRSRNDKCTIVDFGSHSTFIIISEEPINDSPLY